MQQCNRKYRWNTYPAKLCVLVWPEDSKWHTLLQSLQGLAA
jgi:hypothetical protein